MAEQDGGNGKWKAKTFQRKLEEAHAERDKETNATNKKKLERKIQHLQDMVAKRTKEEQKETSKEETEKIVREETGRSPRTPRNDGHIDKDDIKIFFGKSSSRKRNDVYNKVREEILVQLPTLVAKYGNNDTDTGMRWKDLHAAWQNIISNLTLHKFDSFNVVKKAGRQHNYDFLVTYYDKDGKKLDDKKVEFKNNAMSIASLPQILQLYEQKVSIIPAESYTRFYYDNYLNDIIGDNDELKANKPRWTEYSKHINSTTPPSEFFKILKRVNNSRIRDITKQSIKDYIKRYKDKVDLKELSRLIASSQRDKVYIMWKDGRFYVDQISNDGLAMKSVEDDIKNGHTFIVRSKDNEVIYYITLRWQNTIGVLNPTYQIKIKYDS